MRPKEVKVREKAEWKLVPVEPTDEMLDAADVPARVHPDAYFRAVYRAMLAAAPEPPADEKGGSQENRLRVLYESGDDLDSARGERR